jgi:hypothetical protein
MTIAPLAAVASLGGLQLSNLYRDNAFVTSAWKGTDAVTLFVAVPLLAIAVAFARHGSWRALLVWFGVIDYLLYNYAFYVFGAAFNEFFLLHVTVFTLSIFTLLYGLVTLDASALSRRFASDTPVKWISGYMMAVAIALSTIYVIQTVSFATTGRLPNIVIATEHPTSVVFALDLSLFVPWLVLGAVWLARHQPWGYVVATIVNVKGAIYALGLAVASLWANQSGLAEAAGQIPLWLALAVGSGAAATALLVHMRPGEGEERL